MEIVSFTATAIVSHLGVRYAPSPWLKTAMAIAPVALFRFSSPAFQVGLIALTAYNFYVFYTNKPPASPPSEPPTPIIPLPLTETSETTPPSELPTQAFTPPEFRRCTAHEISFAKSPLGESLESILRDVQIEASKMDLGLRWHGKGSLQRVFFQLLLKDGNFQQLWNVEANRPSLILLLRSSQTIFTGPLRVSEVFEHGLKDCTPAYLNSSPLYYDFGTYGCDFEWTAAGGPKKTVTAAKASPQIDHQEILNQMYDLCFTTRGGLVQIQQLSAPQLVQTVLKLLRNNIHAVTGSQAHNDLKALGEQGYHWLSDLRRLFEIVSSEEKQKVLHGPEFAHAFDIAHLAAMLHRSYNSSALDDEYKALRTVLDTAPLGFGGATAPKTIRHFDVGQQYFQILIEQFQRGQLDSETSNALRIRLEATLYRLCCHTQQLPLLPTSPLSEWKLPDLFPIPTSAPSTYGTSIPHETWDPRIHSALIWTEYPEIPGKVSTPQEGDLTWQLTPGQMIKISKKYIICWPVMTGDPSNDLQVLEQFYYYLWHDRWNLFELTRMVDTSPPQHLGWRPNGEDFYTPKPISLLTPPEWDIRLCLQAAVNVYLRIIRLDKPRTDTHRTSRLEPKYEDWRTHFREIVTFDRFSQQEISQVWEEVCAGEPSADLTKPLDCLATRYDRYDVLTKQIQLQPKLQITDGLAPAQKCLGYLLVPGADQLTVAPVPDLLQFETEDSKWKIAIQEIYRALDQFLTPQSTKKVIEAFVGHNGKPYTVEKSKGSASITITWPVSIEELGVWGYDSAPDQNHDLVLQINSKGSWSYSLPKTCKKKAPSPENAPGELSAEILLEGYFISVLQQILAYHQLKMLNTPNLSDKAEVMKGLWEGAKLLQSRFSTVAGESVIVLRNPVLCSKDATFEVKGTPLTEERLNHYGMSFGIEVSSKKQSLGRGFGRGAEGREVSILIGATLQSHPCAEFIISNDSSDGGLGAHWSLKTVKRYRVVEQSGKLDIRLDISSKDSFSDGMFGVDTADVKKLSKPATEKEIQEDLLYLNQAFGSIFSMLQSEHTIMDGAKTITGQLHSDTALAKLALLIQGPVQNQGFQAGLGYKTPLSLITLKAQQEQTTYLKTLRSPTLMLK